MSSIDSNSSRNSLIDQKEDENLRNSFYKYAKSLSDLARSVGIDLQPVSSPSLPYFSSLPSENKRGVIRAITQYLEICEATIASGHSLLDSRRITWNALKALGLTPCSDFLDKIGDGDIIEIYDTQNLQIFRNFEFFQLCSYTIEEIYCRPWTTLFKRIDETITTQIVSTVERIVTENKRQTYTLNIPEHIVEEADSPFRLRMNVKLKYLSPLYANGSINALIAVEEANLLGAPLDDLQKERLLAAHYKLTPDNLQP